MSIKSRLGVALKKADNEAEVKGLRALLDSVSGRVIECLDDGFVKLVDHMGGDAAVVQAARVSYGAGTKTVSDDATLIRYLMRHRHTTPLEMVEFKFLVRVPMDCWRQWIRHRTASVNEYSTRYSEAIDSQQATPPDQWRLQSAANKQGSGACLDQWPDPVPNQVQNNMICNEPADYESPGAYLSEREIEFQENACKLYEERLLLGVAREQARKDLPLSTYTEAYWKIDCTICFISSRSAWTATRSWRFAPTPTRSSS